MDITVRGRHIELGQAIVERVEQSLRDIFEKYFGDAIRASVNFNKEREEFKAVVSVHVHKGLDMQSEAMAGDAYLAYDQAATKLAKRLRRHKRRLKDHHEQSRAAEAGKASQFVLAPLPEDDDETTMANDDGPLIIAESQSELLNLPVNLAVTHMDLTESPTFVFQNAKSGRVNVLYRRSDGHIGWIDPQLT